MHSINKIYPEIKEYDTDSYFAYLKCKNLTKKLKEQQLNLLNEAINE